MTKEELTADVLKGFLLIVGEYRGSHAEVAGYVDKKTGEAIQHVRATHWWSALGRGVSIASLLRSILRTRSGQSSRGPRLELPAVYLSVSAHALPTVYVGCQRQMPPHYAMNTQASRERRKQRFDSSEGEERAAGHTQPPDLERQIAAFPDPWLFDTKELLESAPKNIIV